MSSEIPNYLAPANESIDHNNDNEKYGANVDKPIGPSTPTFNNVAQDFLLTDLMNLQNVHEDKPVKSYLELQQTMHDLQKIENNFDPPFVDGVLDYPIQLDHEPYDPLTEYAEKNLKYNPLFILKDMRGPF